MGTAQVSFVPILLPTPEILCCRDSRLRNFDRNPREILYSVVLRRAVGSIFVETDNCDVSDRPVWVEGASFSIGDLSREFGVTARALRFYEEEGLISPRRDGATRIYSKRDRARLVWILRGKSVGFSLDEIGELLDLYDLNDGRVTQRAVTAERCRARAEALRGQIAELQSAMDQLTRFATQLEAQHV